MPITDSTIEIINPLLHPICLANPDYMPSSYWYEHAPFAMWLVDVLRPRILVELGTHNGYSYCAMCQTVKELDLDTCCYAIDSWQGDVHYGEYSSEVLETLRSYHDPRYGSFSRLVQSSFDDALTHFQEASIDLLHIDGTHTFDAVKHDFQTWLPKMSDRGIVLFHDINVREGAFGVWRLWDEIKIRYPAFDFLHCQGLGVISVGPSRPMELDQLFAANDESRIVLRALFQNLGSRLTVLANSGKGTDTPLMQQLKRAETIAASLRAELDAVRSSASWRLTAPIRAVASLFHRHPRT